VVFAERLNKRRSSVVQRLRLRNQVFEVRFGAIRPLPSGPGALCEPRGGRGASFQASLRLTMTRFAKAETTNYWLAFLAKPL
jgi:hypothetical protein